MVVSIVEDDAVFTHLAVIGGGLFVEMEVQHIGPLIVVEPHLRPGQLEKVVDCLQQMIDTLFGKRF